VILLDEIEKAHRDVFNILLQVLDDGRLTDNHGHTVDFTNTIVVMTSNLGSQALMHIAQACGSHEEMRDAVQESVRTHFLPEFINRIDEVIVFHPLARDQIRRIVDLQVVRLARQLTQNEIELEVSEAARNAIAAEGYDATYGARPLKRVIQQKIQNPLATELLRGRVAAGGTVHVDFQGGELVLKAVAKGEPLETTQA
jgi:ATP-dependent Clp protease ATP-binding subunit ClpB